MKSAILTAGLMTFAVSAPASAQGFASPRMVQDISGNSAVERLGRFIRTLTAAPRDLTALLGAGQAALDVGDPNAALGFFARAEVVAPDNWRAKAGLGSALVEIERPDDALRLFGEAIARGAREIDVARDRGLAFDLRGDTARAQRDYALALSQGGDDELVRRSALSLAIAGDRAAALARLDPLLRRQDQGAWRARAFVYAMTGDVVSAKRVAGQLMAPAMANAMGPLLNRLATLNPAERAHAVNFGTVPSDGTQLAAVRLGDPYVAPSYAAPPRPSSVVTARRAMPPPAPVTLAGNGLIPSGEPLGPRQTPVAREPVRTAARQTMTMAAPAPIAQAVPASSFAPPPVPKISPQAGFTQEPVRVASPAPQPVPPRGEMVAASPMAVAMPPSAALQATPGVGPFEVAGPPAALATVTAPVGTVPVGTVPGTQIATIVSTLVATTPLPGRLSGLLADVAPEPETIVELPSARDLRLARAAARKKLAEVAAAAAADREEKAEKAEAAAAARRSPARLWVQVATGANDRGLALTWRRIRDDNDKALVGQSAYSAAYRATNRVLVGPMKSPAAARELVRALGKNGVAAMTYSSEAGEEIARIAAK